MLASAERKLQAANFKRFRNFHIHEQRQGHFDYILLPHHT